MDRDRYQVRVTLTAVPLPAEKKPLFDHSCLMLLDLVDSFFEEEEGRGTPRPYNGKTALKNDGDDRFIGHGQKGGVRSPYTGKYEIVGSGCDREICAADEEKGRSALRPYVEEVVA